MGSEVEALSRSFRSRIVLLVLVVAAGLGLAIWSGTRAQGIGEPEDRRRVMVVTRGADVDYFPVLERGGFAIEVDDYEGWLAAARAADADSEAQGVAAILEHADRRGDAIVVFERPAELDLSGVETEPALDEIDELERRDYVALSVGDYAFPHRLTVDAPGDDPLLRLPGYGALEAVFAQPLISAREDPERPTVPELQFEDAITLARQMIEHPAGFAKLLERTEAGIAAQLDDGSGARPLIPHLSTGTAIPTPDGGVLVLHHALVPYSDDARILAIEAAPQMQIGWLGPEAVARVVAGEEPVLAPCPSLAGGALTMAEVPRIDAAFDGSSLALGDVDGSSTVWRKAGPGCAWAAIAELEPDGALELAPAWPPAASVAASAVVRDDAGVVLHWALPDAQPDPGPPLVEPQPLLRQAGRRFAAPVFVDDRTLAVGSAYPSEDRDDPREARIYLLDRTRPGVYLSVPVDFFAPGRRIQSLHRLAAADEAGGPQLLLVAREPLGEIELIRVRIGRDAWAAFAAASPADPSPGGPGVEGHMVSLTPEQLVGEVLHTTDRVLEVGVGPGLIVYATGAGPRPGELVALELATGELRSLTDNQTRDYLPRIAADRSFMTLASLVQAKLTDAPHSVPRLLGLGPAPASP